MSEQTIYARLVQAGMTPIGACAMMANMKDESAMKANNVQDGYGYSDEGYTAQVDAGIIDFVGDGIGYGLCQWTYGARKLNLLNFARSRGVSIGDENMQVDFCIRELQTEYASLWRYLCGAMGAAEAAERICKEYERPAETNINSQERAAYANQYYMQYGGMDVSNVPVGPAAPTGDPRGPENEIFYTPASEMATYWPPRTLELDMFGGDVAALHGLLVAHGYNAPLSWTFDVKTRAMVMAFQAEHDLEPDGICGPVTWAALLARG